jgi:hypothetical protein
MRVTVVGSQSLVGEDLEATLAAEQHSRHRKSGRLPAVAEEL